MNIYPFIGIAIAAVIRGAYGSWKTNRNSLPDDERALIFWNDDRYEALQRWIDRLLWGFVAIGGTFAIWIFGVSQNWWCWPWTCT